jgi:glutamate--cysteine ligase
MSGPQSASAAPIESKAQLVDYLAAGSKPPEDWRIGTEHEKFAFRLSDLRPLPYDGPDGIRAVLEGLAGCGWERVEENGNLIALIRDKASVTLEPGGQVELSGAPLRSIHETCAEVADHLALVKTVGEQLGIGMIGLGFQPKWRREDIGWMPKGRYKIMRDYMPKRGSLGLDMMKRTCTVQVNLDFASEADMVKKFRASLALQPIATALFANSPFTEGKPNGFQSMRSHIWTDTDPDRTGDLPFVFEDGFGFERYVDYLLDVPMYFVYRDGQYIDASGHSFRAFLKGELPVYPGHLPTLNDWADHLTTAFPEVRLKKFLEMRGADGGPWSRLCALPALWVGLLYDGTALDAAWDLVKDWTTSERALQVLAIARQGLAARAATDDIGGTEEGFLNELQRIADSGETQASEMLRRYETEWGGSVDPVFSAYAY